MKTRILTAILSAVLWVGFFSLPIVQTGCQQPPSQRVVQVQSLKAVGLAVDGGMKAAAQLYHNGQITEAQWNKVADFHDNKFLPAFNLAVAAVQSDLSSAASPDVLALATQFANLVAQLTTK